jgi:SpoVK/Ycf46/Vps4 family AAA+-type ATPase
MNNIINNNKMNNNNVDPTPNDLLGKKKKFIPRNNNNRTNNRNNYKNYNNYNNNNRTNNRNNYNNYNNNRNWYNKKNKNLNENNVTNHLDIEKSIKGTSPNQQAHIIVRSTNNPTNMRIIPFNNIQNLNPLMIQANLIKSMFKKTEPIAKQKEAVVSEEFVELSNIETIDDLIRIGTEYDINDKRRYSINMLRLKNIVEPLKELKNVIGMESVKKNIFEQLLYLLQELNDTNMMHTVIEGPPGVGKTLLGKILAKIYYKLNFLKKLEVSSETQEINEIANHLMQMLNPESILSKEQNEQKEKELKEKKEKKEEEFKFRVVRRSDLVGQFVGSTALKTQKAIDESFGGVLFIDEVYSLGSGHSNDKGDSFAKEAIDTLNQNLSENGDKFICIIAGYPDEIDRCFFAQNEGLKRRFPFKYSIEKYNSNELAKILEFKINEIKWKLDASLSINEIEKFIEKNKKYFDSFGGDIENFLLSIKIKHSVRVFGKNPNLKKSINIDDIKNAYDVYLKAKKEKDIPQFVKDMYI